MALIHGHIPRVVLGREGAIEARELSDESTLGSSRDQESTAQKEEQNRRTSRGERKRGGSSHGFAKGVWFGAGNDGIYDLRSGAEGKGGGNAKQRRSV